ncbi:probable G-protein coupled receptor 139 [Scyliorhinus torazame]|uniref:probable G-protein coupled receptor 139 n=1 Tax=Scyliorhinus torazame TaxID=75743 RepID=UPI003B5BB7E4
MHGPANGPFYAIYYPALAIIGVPANLVAIIILSRGRCGLSRFITYYLVAIAVTDFLVMVTAVRYTPGCAVSTVLVYATRDGSVWLTVAFTFDRFVSICYQKLKTRYCTEKTALLVIGMVITLSYVKNVPFYFTYQPLYILDGVPWFCDIKSSYYTIPSWQAYDWLVHILTPFLPFFFILLLNALTVRHIVEASRARRRLKGSESAGDPEIANRKKSIVLLFTISLNFLLLWATYVGHFLYVRVTAEAYFTGLDFNDPHLIFVETTNMLQLLSSCNNTFIYAVAQNKFRNELKKLLTFPFAIITSCFRLNSAS